MGREKGSKTLHKPGAQLLPHPTLTGTCFENERRTFATQCLFLQSPESGQKEAMIDGIKAWEIKWGQESWLKSVQINHLFWSRKPITFPKKGIFKTGWKLSRSAVIIYITDGSMNRSLIRFWTEGSGYNEWWEKNIWWRLLQQQQKLLLHPKHKLRICLILGVLWIIRGMYVLYWLCMYVCICLFAYLFPIKFIWKWYNSFQL